MVRNWNFRSKMWWTQISLKWWWISFQPVGQKLMIYWWQAKEHLDQVGSTLRHYPEIISLTERMCLSMVVKGIKRKFKKSVNKKNPLEYVDLKSLWRQFLTGKVLKKWNLKIFGLLRWIFTKNLLHLRVSHVVDDEGDLAVPVWRIKWKYSDESAISSV